MKYSLADIKRSYTPEKAWAEMQGELPCYLIYRPLSFYPSWLLLRLGVPIMAVTLSSGVLALVMAFLAWQGRPWAWLAVVASGFCFHVLDCVDGNMARTTGRFSRLGALLDGTIRPVIRTGFLERGVVLVLVEGGYKVKSWRSKALLSATLLFKKTH